MLPQNLLHHLFVGHRQRSVRADRAGKPQLFGNISGRIHRLVGSNGKDAVYVVFLCRGKAGGNIKGAGLYMKIRQLRRRRVIVIINQNCLMPQRMRGNQGILLAVGTAENH